MHETCNLLRNANNALIEYEESLDDSDEDVNAAIEHNDKVIESLEEKLEELK